MKYRNPIELADGRIDCEIEHPVYGWIPFTCDPKDAGAEVNVTDLYARLKKSKVLKKEEPEVVKEKAAARVRGQRDELLAREVDPITTNILRWEELTEEEKALVREYRHALLYVTDQTGFPTAVEWPTPPAFISK